MVPTGLPFSAMTKGGRSWSMTPGFSIRKDSIAAEALGRMLRRYLVPDYLDSVIVLAFVVGVFTASNLLAHEAGLLAVTVMGMRLANMKGVPLEDILSFKETLTILLISVLFIVLAARLDVAQLAEVGKGVVLVFMAIQFVAQPLKVWASTWGSGLRWQEKALIAWIGPRGIVAAAVSAASAAVSAPRITVPDTVRATASMSDSSGAS